MNYVLRPTVFVHSWGIINNTNSGNYGNDDTFLSFTSFSFDLEEEEDTGGQSLFRSKTRIWRDTSSLYFLTVDRDRFFKNKLKSSGCIPMLMCYDITVYRSCIYEYFYKYFIRCGSLIFRRVCTGTVWHTTSSLLKKVINLYEEKINVGLPRLKMTKEPPDLVDYEVECLGVEDNNRITVIDSVVNF